MLGWDGEGVVEVLFVKMERERRGGVCFRWNKGCEAVRSEWGSGDVFFILGLVEGAGLEGWLLGG